MLFDLRQYYPDYINEIKDINEILQVDSMELRRIYIKMQQVNNNFTVENCDDDTLSQYETILSIYPSSDETIKQRKENVYTELNRHLPYTIETLKELLNSILTEKGYRLTIDHAQQKINVIVFALDGIGISMVKTIETLLLKIPPAHLGILVTLGIEINTTPSEYYATVYTNSSRYTIEYTY